MKIVSSLAQVGLSVLVMLAIVTPAVRAETRKSKASEDVTTVELFAAMKSGDVEVKVIAKDSDGGNVLITNKTDKPLAIILPEVFAATPVLAQFGGPFGGLGAGAGAGGAGNFSGIQNGTGGGQNMNQAVGGGFQGGNGMQGGGNGMMNGMGFNGGMFKVEPDKVRKIKMVTVCLEHGKPNPNAHIEYELQPLDSVTKNAQTIETVKMLARGQIDQKSAQAAAWNVENGMTWEKLAAKIGVKHITGKTDPYFTSAQIALGQKIVKEAARRASATETKSPTQSSSLAQTK